jgi:hypothetical protein
MARLKRVRSKHLCPLLFFDQLTHRPRSGCGPRGRDPPGARLASSSEPLLGLGEFLDSCERSVPQCLLQPLGDQVVLLTSFLGDHRLDGSAQLRVIALAGGFHEMDK